MSEPKRQLINVIASKHSRTWATKIIVVEKINGEKVVNIVEEPTIQFYIQKRDVWENQHGRITVPYTNIENCEQIECNYDDVFNAIAELSGEYIDGATERDTQFIYECYANKQRSSLRRLHGYNFLMGTDLEIADHYYDRYFKENEQNIEILPVHKVYWDIENDTVKHRKVPNPKEAPCMTNAISLFDPKSMTLYGYLLRNSEKENPLIAEFEETLPEFISDFQNELRDELIADKKKQFKGKESDFTFKEEDVNVRVVIFMHEDEKSLIKAYFKMLHHINPDIAGAWNHAYDIQTLINRCIHLGIEPRKVFCNDSIPLAYQQVYYHEDDRYRKLVEKRDRWTITSSTQYTDMMINYMRIRASQPAKESYALDAILEDEIDKNKEDYGNVELADLPYVDYKKFVRYSLKDSFRLWQLDCATGDTELLYDMSMYTRSRFEKGMSKTTSLRNLAFWYFREKFGIALSNNHNAISTNSGVEKDLTSFRGAYVANPNNLANTGISLFGVPSQYLYELICDDDFAALYPNIMMAWCLDILRQIGKLEFVGDGPLNDEGINKAIEFVDSYFARDSVLLGSDFLSLPNHEELVDIFMELRSIRDGVEVPEQ